MTPAERLAAFVTAWRGDGRKRVAVAFTKTGAVHLDTADIEAVLVELAVARVRIADLEAEVVELREGLDEATAERCIHDHVMSGCTHCDALDADDEQFDLTDDDEALGDAEAFYAYP
jgi:cell division GTPase FtsZ